MVRNQVDLVGHGSGGHVVQSHGQVLPSQTMPDKKMTMQQMKDRELVQPQDGQSQQANGTASPPAALGQQVVDKQSHLTAVDLAALDPLMRATVQSAAAAVPPFGQTAPVVSMSPILESASFGEIESAPVVAAVAASPGPNEKLIAAAAVHHLPVPSEPPPPPPMVSPPALPPQTLPVSSYQVLQEMFPTIQDHVIAAALVHSAGNPEAAASLLLGVHRQEGRHAEIPLPKRSAHEPAQSFQASSVASNHERPLQAMTPAFYNAPEPRGIRSKRLTGEKPSWAKTGQRLTGSVTSAVEAARVKVAKHRVRKYGHVE